MKRPFAVIGFTYLLVLASVSALRLQIVLCLDVYKRQVYDRGLYEDLFRVAGRKSIPCQPKAATSGGNDAGEIHKSREGVRTAAISMPCRYLHSAVCVIAKEDLFAMESLTIAAANEVLSHD